MRKEILLNENWYFHKGDIKVESPADKGPVYSQSKTIRKQVGPAAYSYIDRPDPYGAGVELLNHERWSIVSIPHDYIIHQDLTPDENPTLGFLHYDNAWYRKHFTLPENSEGKRILLRFDGIATKSIVYVNGCVMKHNYSAYNTFEIDISDVVYFDKENVIAVYVNTEDFEGWWYQGGGIYRDVHLTITEPVAIDLWGVYAPTKKIDEHTWKVDFETTLVNSDFEDRSITVTSYILDAEGNTVAQAQASGSCTEREKTVFNYSTTVYDPKLWDCETPNLYKIKTSVSVNGEIWDEDYTRIGFRTIEFSKDKGFLLNGKKTILKGLCGGHQDCGLTGLAVPENVAKYKVSLMKEMGANAFRTTHYQYTNAYLDAFDEMGIMVMDEARWFESTDEAYEQLDSLLKRDRNRPCVIFWSTSNEEPLHTTDIGRRIHKSIMAHIRKFDKNRTVTAAVCHSPAQCQIYKDCEIIGINYTLGIYDTVHEQFPDKLIFASECCATGTSRDWNFASAGNFRLRDKDADAYDSYFKNREETWKFLMERPYVFGGFQWDAFEHRGEAIWPAASSKAGAIDLYLQKKGAFYQNQGFWIDKPMVHIVPHWNFKGLEGENILVTVYTNCDELELFRNGESFGKKQIEKYGHGEWNVPYEAGTLSVVGYRNGEIVCTDERVTTKKAVALKLRLENECEPNGSNLAIFTCECLDEDGRVVPDASEFVRFYVSTPAVIVGTGSDHSDPANVANNSRKMYMGKISIAVKPQKGQTEFSLIAISDNCNMTKLDVKL